MKTKLLTSILVGLLGVAASVYSAEPAADSRVQVMFDHPEKFTDVKDSMIGTDRGRDAILSELQRYLQRTASRRLGEGQKLEVTVTDVDLAGDYEPWHRPEMQDVRMVKDIYPPRISLFFKLTDAAGATVKEGTRKLTDLSFQTNIQIDNRDPLRYEKRLLSDWVYSEFPNQRK